MSDANPTPAVTKISSIPAKARAFIGANLKPGDRYRDGPTAQ